MKSEKVFNFFDLHQKEKKKWFSYHYAEEKIRKQYQENSKTKKQ